jgi:hypothetical protein
MFILCLCAEAQFAADYLKPSPGSTWKYQRYDLDSVQQIIAASKRIVTDSLTGTVTKKAITGYVLKSRNSPLRDSTIVSLNNDVISYYNGGYPVEGLSRAADSLGLGFIPQALNWYPYQKFNSPPLNNRVDTLFRRDSTIFVDSVEFPLTLVITRLRRPAGVVSVPAGTFISAVPFEITMNVDTWIFTPLGRFAVPLLKLTDTLFVAKNNWIVKEIQGSTYFPLTAIDNDSVPHFKIPGYVRLLELQTLTAVDREPAAPLSLTIGQNFPNPFNGTTMIPLAASTRTALTIEVFDLLGRFVDTVTDGIVDPGEYQFQWNSGSRPSGLYLCWISANGRTTVKKMLLQK